MSSTVALPDLSFRWSKKAVAFLFSGLEVLLCCFVLQSQTMAGELLTFHFYSISIASVYPDH